MASIQYCSDSVSLDYYGKKSNSNNSVLHQVFDIQMEPEHFLLRSMDTKIKRKFIQLHTTSWRDSENIYLLSSITKTKVKKGFDQSLDHVLPLNI